MEYIFHHHHLANQLKSRNCHPKYYFVNNHFSDFQIGALNICCTQVGYFFLFKWIQFKHQTLAAFYIK
jgi:hypothetical protein